MNRPQIKRNHPANAFTLIELLVVISVIAMLLAILTPSLTRAKESGRRVTCKANMHNLTLAWLAYASENKDRLCSPNTNWNGLQPWDDTVSATSHNWVSDGPGLGINDFCNTEFAITTGVLWPYLESLDVYRCNSESTESPRSYAISKTMGGDSNEDFKRTTQISTPSQKMVFIDFDPPVRDSGGQVTNVADKACSDPIDIPKQQWKACPCGGGNVWSHSTRHNDGSNVSFADGHIDYWRWKDERTVLLIDGLIGSEEEILQASIDNDDIPRWIPALRGRHE